MKRRTFLKGLAATAAASPILINGIPVRASTSLPLLAQMQQNASDKILIFIQLFGGNDGLNTVIPISEPNYYKLRPNIGIPQQQAVEVVPGIFFNPGLAKGSQGGLAAGLSGSEAWLAVVQGVGYENPNLSHFRSTDIYLSGINPANNTDPNIRLDTGWVGRMLEKNYPTFPQQLPDDPLAIQLGGFSLTLVSEKGRMGIEVSNPSAQAGVSSDLATIDTAAAGTHYADEYAFVADIASRSNKYAQNVRNAYAKGKSKLTANYASDSFAKQMSSVAALIAGGLKTNVYVVSLGGFDTHVSQQSPDDAASGQHPTLLGRVGDGISQFMYDMIKLGLADNVIGMTVSEFGRRPAENGSFGTDHGAASVQFVWGTQVNSAVYGNTPDLSNLDEYGDLNYQYDYRRIYCDILMKWFGLTLADARAVLQDDSIVPLEIIKIQAGISQTDPSISPLVKLTNYPNPFVTSTTFELKLANDASVTFDISNVAGERVARIFDRRLSAGTHAIPFNVNGLPTGVYLCSVIADGQRFSHFVQCTR